MTMLAQTDLAAPAATRAARRAVLEHAVAEAPSNVLPPRGIRRLFARDRSAAALIRRYGLWPAIEHAYELVVNEFGSAEVSVSAEDDPHGAYVLMECVVPVEEVGLELESEIRLKCDELIRPAHRLRLSVFLEEPDSDDDL